MIHCGMAHYRSKSGCEQAQMYRFGSTDGQGDLGEEIDKAVGRTVLPWAIGAALLVMAVNKQRTGSAFKSKRWG